MIELRAELLRYLLSGAVATVVHFVVLTINVEVLALESVGLANFIAAIFGSTSAFLGNRYLVFRTVREPLVKQLAKFSGLYFSVACFHGLALFIWSDLLRWNYAHGFVVATMIQIAFGYLGNKLWVFKA
ncbi:MAG: GtrA family protein [Arenimonas sp.]|jgi:putative flippase GtrA